MLIFAVTVEAGASTKFISIKAGSQYFNQDVEIAKTKAEQDQRANVFGISFDTRLQYFTWGVSITGFENDWKAKQPGTRTDGSYKVLTVAVEIKKYFRLYRDMFFYGGGGLGVSRIESRYTKDLVGRTDGDALFTLLGTLGIEWRFDTHAIFLDSQWFGMDGNSNINSSGSNHRDNLYPSSSGPRLMLGIGFFF
ncbi:MAG: hypothetical protein ACC635_04805 [Acidiferrobacterales bacterium]